MIGHPIIRRTSLNQLLNDFEKEVNQFLEHSTDMGIPMPTADWMPAIDMREEKNKFIIQADIPGLDFKDIDVTLENHTLLIKGEREKEHKEKHEGFMRMERAKGSFVRAITLPESANLEKIDAKYDQGVLTIEIPKSAERAAGRKKITVKH